jgi:cell division protein FtsZ
MVKKGLVNLDFADVETVMSSMGKAMMGTGEAEGEGRAAKATDMALNNPLIDDYSLKGAKGLLINITGGESLTLFEVDEIVNKIRAEVDSTAEIINGSIIDPALENKIRVSIVATALDGQQPESKSVINMVHRIQNRNPGYSDFSNLGPTQAFNFSNTISSPTIDGANALKLENEVMAETSLQTSTTGSIKDLNNEYNEQVLNNQEGEVDFKNDDEVNFYQTSLVEESSNETQQVSNGLENFEIEEETPELFNTENDEVFENISSLDSKEKEDSTEEDDLEIPAFLRRQKN